MVSGDEVLIGPAAADRGWPAKYRDPMDLDFYASPGPLTRLTTEQAELVRRLDLAPIGLCRAAKCLLVSPPHAAAGGCSPAEIDRAMAEIDRYFKDVLDAENSTKWVRPENRP